jgi:uncharacterized membrane protein
MTKLFSIIFLIFILALIIPFFIFGMQINLNDQYKILENLKSIFSILFALFGIWIAICNPLTTDSEKLEKINFNKILESLFLCIISLVLIGFCFFFIPILKQFDFFKNYKEICKVSLFIFIYLLTLIQTYTLFISLAPNALIKNFLDRKKASDQLLTQQKILKK